MGNSGDQILLFPTLKIAPGGSSQKPGPGQALPQRSSSSASAAVICFPGSAGEAPAVPDPPFCSFGKLQLFPALLFAVFRKFQMFLILPFPGLGRSSFFQPPFLQFWEAPAAPNPPIFSFWQAPAVPNAPILSFEKLQLFPTFPFPLWEAPAVPVPPISSFLEAPAVPNAPFCMEGML